MARSELKSPTGAVVNDMITSTENRAAQSEALALSDEILRNIELSELPLTKILLKTSRLARLLNDMEMLELCRYEATGYPSTPDGVEPKIFDLATRAGRQSVSRDPESGKDKITVSIQGVGEWEESLRAASLQLSQAADAPVSLSSANPNQFVGGLGTTNIGNTKERDRLREVIVQRSKSISNSQAFVHKYVLERHYDLKLSGIARDAFSSLQQRADTLLGSRVPGGAQKLVSVLDNLQSENTEDWANAVHSCRRLLQDVADAIFPATTPRQKTVNGKLFPIKLGPDNYVNRIIAYVDDNSDSERFEELVGSNLAFMGDRLDAIFKAAQKGSHASVSREEAERYVLYTYMLVADVLSLSPSPLPAAVE